MKFDHESLLVFFLFCIQLTSFTGKTGISILFYDRFKEYMIPNIERKAGFKFERITAPHPADLAKSSCASAIEKLKEVSDR
jgi:ATP-dependent RNA helicase DDX21